MITNPTAEMLREAATELLPTRPDLSMHLAALAATITLLPQIFGPDQGATSSAPPLALVPPPGGRGDGAEDTPTKEAR